MNINNKDQFAQVPLGLRRFWGETQANFMVALLNLKKSAGKNRETIYFSFTFNADDLGVTRGVLINIFKHWKKQKLVEPVGRANYNQTVCKLNIKRIEKQITVLNRIRHEIVHKERPDNKKAQQLYIRRIITFGKFVKMLGFTKEKLKEYATLPVKEEYVVPAKNRLKAQPNQKDETVHKHVTTAADVRRELDFEFANSYGDGNSDRFNAVLENDASNYLYANTIPNKYGDLTSFKDLDNRLRGEEGWPDLRPFFRAKMK